MMIATRFGKKLRVPSTFQIKHQLLLFWLKDQLAKEAAGGKTDERIPCTDGAPIAESRVHATPSGTNRAGRLVSDAATHKLIESYTFRQRNGTNARSERFIPDEQRT
jgi:hypothetical protein